jgi:hypothetical protein
MVVPYKGIVRIKTLSNLWMRRKLIKVPYHYVLLSRFCKVLTYTSMNLAFEVKFLVPLSGASDSYTVSSVID